MTASYDPQISRTLDQVRLVIGDTDDGNPQLQDEEILWILTQEPDPTSAAVLAADAIAARYARQVDIAVGPVRQNLMQLQTSYQMLADRLRRQLARRGISPFVGGLSLAAKDLAITDTDLVQPDFRRGMQEEPGTDPDGGDAYWSIDSGIPPF